MAETLVEESAYIQVSDMGIADLYAFHHRAPPHSIRQGIRLPILLPHSAQPRTHLDRHFIQAIHSRQLSHPTTAYMHRQDVALAYPFSDDTMTSIHKLGDGDESLGAARDEIETI